MSQKNILKIRSTIDTIDKQIIKLLGLRKKQVLKIAKYKNKSTIVDKKRINQIHKDWVRELGWNYPDDLYDPAKNLRFAYLLWADDGWKHWKTSR